MGGKRKPAEVEWIHCLPCRKDVRNCSENVVVHNSSKSHERYVELFSKREILENWNVRWAPGGRAFLCHTCNSELGCSFSKIEKHISDHHKVLLDRDLMMEEKDFMKQGLELQKVDFGASIQLQGDHQGEDKPPTDGGTIRCEPCRKEVPNSLDNISVHNNSDGHKRYAELLSKKSTLDRWNIGWAPSGRAFFCFSCEVLLDCSFVKLEKHFVQHHTLPLESEPQMEVYKAFKPKNYYASSKYDFEAEKESFSLLEGPVQLNEFIGNCVGLLRHQVIPTHFVSRLYDTASFLEARARDIKRSKKKAGTRMVMFGFYNHGSCGWFKHDDHSLYALSEKFIGDVSYYLRVSFPKHMARLDNNLLVEGFENGEGGFAGTPFTCYSITRDYECAPHDDPTDYGYGFLVWLHPGDKVEVEDLPSIWLSQYNVRFQPPQASAFLFNSVSTVHCTSCPRKTGILGMAFVQKRNFITQMRGIILDPESKVGSRYLKAKDLYEKQRESSRPEAVYHRRAL